MKEGMLFKWTDKDGKRLSGKEFIRRWKEGMERVTPLQQARIQLMNYVPIFLGIIGGAIGAFYTKTWWLFIILLGSLGLTSIQALGILQRYWALKRIDEEMRLINSETEKEVENETTNKTTINESS